MATKNNRAYVVIATPCDDVHGQHEVCAFSSMEGALQLVEKWPESLDIDDNCKWIYTVKVRPMKAGESLDRGPPDYFPY